MWSCGELGCVLAPLLVSVSGPYLNGSICYHGYLREGFSLGQ